MRTAKPLTAIGYRMDTPAVLEALRQKGILQDYACQKHDQDIDDDGKPKDPHYHILLIPAKVIDTVKLANDTKVPNGFAPDGKPLYNFMLRFKDENMICTSIGHWYGYSVLHDPSVVREDDKDGKHPYSPDTATYSSPEYAAYLADKWEHTAVAGVNEDADNPIIKAEKKAIAQREKNRTTIQTVIDLVQQGATDLTIMAEVGRYDVGFTRLIDKVRYEVNPDHITQTDACRYRDNARRYADELKRMRQALDDANDKLRLYHSLQENPKTATVLAQLVRTANPVDTTTLVPVGDEEEIPF